MATRQAEAMALVHRVQAVVRDNPAEWKITRSTAGYRVKCPDGAVIPIHLTPSDRYTTPNTLEQLIEHGLDRAEVAAEARREKAREEKLAADAKANERKTERLAKQSAALAKAAGPYGPAAVTIDDLIAEHRAPFTFTRVLVTPEMAKRLLERNTRNRPVRDWRVRLFCTLLRTGEFLYTHQGAAIDCDGFIQDGQKRLLAIEDTGIPAELMISVGMPVKNRSAIDAGEARTAAQELALRGIKYGGHTGAALRLLYNWQTYGRDMIPHASDGIALQTVISTMDAGIDNAVMEEACRTAFRLRHEGVRCSMHGVIAPLYLIRTSKAPASMVDRFVADLIRGVSDDPIYTARRQLNLQGTDGRKRLIAVEVMAVLLRAWNATVRGDHSGTGLLWKSGSKMPALEVPGRRAAAIVNDADVAA